MKNLILISLTLAMFACKKDDSSTTPSTSVIDTTIIQLVEGEYPKDGDTILLPKTGGQVYIAFISKAITSDQYQVTYSFNSTFTNGGGWHFVTGNSMGNRHTNGSITLSQLDLTKTNTFWWKITVPNTVYTTGVRHFYVKTY